MIRMKKKDKIHCDITFVIDNSKTICFTQYFDKLDNRIYYFPQIVENGVIYKIDGIDSYYNINFIGISPKKKYLMLSKIGYSYIYEDNAEYFEKYSQVIVDIKNHKVLDELNGSNCDGFWTINDEWLNSDSTIIFR